MALAPDSVLGLTRTCQAPVPTSQKKIFIQELEGN